MIKMVQTCGACPEQYDVFEDKVQIGYIRLRHGSFRVEDVRKGDQIVLQRSFPIDVDNVTDLIDGEQNLPYNTSDGFFDSDQFRQFYLSEAVRRLTDGREEFDPANVCELDMFGPGLDDPVENTPWS